jgi:hypothetical protein
MVLGVRNTCPGSGRRVRSTAGLVFPTHSQSENQDPTAVCFLFDTAFLPVPGEGEQPGESAAFPVPEPKRLPRKIRYAWPVACQGCRVAERARRGADPGRILPDFDTGIEIPASPALKFGLSSHRKEFAYGERGSGDPHYSRSGEAAEKLIEWSGNPEKPSRRG